METKSLPWEKCMMGCVISPDAQVNVLPCLHILCSEACVRKIKMERKNGQEETKCKNCSREFSFDQLTTNVNLKTFLPRKVNLGDVMFKCEICKWDPIVSCCPTCKKNLCRACTEYHPRDPQTRGHKLQYFIEGRKEAEQERFKTNQSKCNIHYGKHVSYFCSTCQQKLCGDCKRIHADSHSVIVVAEELAAIQSGITSTKEIQDLINLSITKLQLKSQSLEQEECKVFIEDVSQFISRALNIIAQYGDAILEEGCKKHLRKQEKIEENIRRLEHAKEDASYFLDIWNRLGDRLDDVGMINVARTSSKFTETLNQIKQELQEKKFQEFVKKGPSVVLTGEELSLKGITFPRAKLVEYQDTPSLPEPINTLPSTATSMTPSTITAPRDHIVTVPSIQRPPRPTRRVAVMKTGGLVGRPVLATKHARKAAPAPVQFRRQRNSPVVTSETCGNNNSIEGGSGSYLRRSLRRRSMVSTAIPGPAKKAKTSLLKR